MPLLLLAFLVSWNVFAEVKLTVTASQFKKAKIAIGKVHSLSNNVPNEALAHKIREQVVEDLSFLNIFEPIPENIFSNYDTGGDNFVIKYEEWVQTQAAFYLRMLYRVEAGKIILEAHLYDIPGLKKVLGNRYQYSANNIPRLVHALSEDISKELTGERGLFFSRVLMTCRDLKSRKEKAPREIYICDSDGKSCANLTQDKTLSVSPSWGSDGNQVVYTQYEWVYGHNKKRKGHVIKVHQLLTGDRIKISSKEGINSGAAWSPDMKRIAATLSFAGRPEIYFLNPVNPEENPVPFSRFIKYRKLSGDGFMITPPSLLFDKLFNPKAWE
jgi:TolB protein